jgi:pimeloyl-[acyl-carrier protein] synthase
MNDTGTDTAGALDFAFADPANLHDRVFLPGLACIREQDPVFWSAQQGGWLLTRHADVIAAFSDQRLSARRLHVAQFHAIPQERHAQDIPNLIRYIPNWIINIDDEQHQRVRKLVMKAFSRKVVQQLRPTVDRVCDELIAKALADGESDFIESIAFPLPASVICGLLGVPDEYMEPLRGWARDMTTALASAHPPREVLLAAERTMREMNDLFLAEFEKRRRKPGEDLLTALLQAREDDEALSEEELLGLCHVLIVAGHDTTANSLGLGLVALLRNPAQRQRYLDGNGIEPMLAMSELLRYVAMASTQIRITRAPVEYGGKAIPPGQVVFLMIAAANRDPRVFEKPDELIFGRPGIEASCTFAPGLHHCLGHMLARMELDTLYRKLFAQASKIELLGEDHRFTPNYAFRGLESIPVRMSR